MHATYVTFITSPWVTNYFLKNWVKTVKKQNISSIRHFLKKQDFSQECAFMNTAKPEVPRSSSLVPLTLQPQISPVPHLSRFHGLFLSFSHSWSPLCRRPRPVMRMPTYFPRDGYSAYLHCLPLSVPVVFLFSPSLDSVLLCSVPSLPQSFILLSSRLSFLLFCPGTSSLLSLADVLPLFNPYVLLKTSRTIHSCSITIIFCSCSLPHLLCTLFSLHLLPCLFPESFHAFASLSSHVLFPYLNRVSALSSSRSFPLTSSFFSPESLLCCSTLRFFNSFPFLSNVPLTHSTTTILPNNTSCQEY